MLINPVVQGRAQQCYAAIVKNSEILRWGYDDSFSHFPSSRHWSIIMSNIHLTLSSKKPFGYNISDARGPGDLYSGVSHANTGSAQHQDIENSAFLVWERDHNKRRRNREVEGLICTSGDSGVPSIRTSRIRMGDLDVATTDYFRREGWNLSLGRSAAEPTSQRTTKSVRR